MGRCVAGASTTDRRKLSNGEGDARPRGMSTRSSENDLGEEPAADGARGDDCADREPCELSLSLRGEPVGPAHMGECSVSQGATGVFLYARVWWDDKPTDATWRNSTRGLAFSADGGVSFTPGNLSAFPGNPM